MNLYRKDAKFDKQYLEGNMVADPYLRKIIDWDGEWLKERKEKDNWKKKRRQEYLKEEFRYHIFCEGQATEPKYFQGFKRYIEDNPIY